MKRSHFQPRRLILLLLAANLWALDTAPASASENRTLRFTGLSLERGLSQSFVTSILQDETGFMWFGTEDGLNRYDGYDFTVYKYDPQDRSSLSHSFVHTLYQDHAGFLWIGTDRGLNRWDPTTDAFERFQHDPSDLASLSNDRVQTIFEDSDRQLWVGTHGGLNLFDRSSKRFTRYIHSPDNPTSLSADGVWCVYEDREKNLWVGTSGGGLNRLDRMTGFFVQYRRDPRDPASLSHDDVRALHEDENGTIWVGTYGGGLSLLDRDRGRFLHLRRDPAKASSLSDDRVNVILEDEAGALWVGTESGLDQWRKASRDFVHHRHDPSDFASLSNDLVRSLYQDRGGVLWVGTRVGGVNKRNASSAAFSHYEHDPESPSSLSSPVVTSFHEDRDGTLWVGTFGGGLNHFDPETGRFEQIRHDPADPSSLASDRVMALLVDAAGSIWVGTMDAGLDRLARGRDAFHHYSHDPDDETALGEKGVTSLFEDSDGSIWVGTFGGGLHRFSAGSDGFVRFKHDPSTSTSLSSDFVTAIHEDDNGWLWVGTEGGGLNRCDRSMGTCVHFRHDPADAGSLSMDVVWSIYQDRAGVLWIGTQGGGLNRVTRSGDEPRKVRFDSYTERDGLANNFVYGIVEDGRGRLWLSTNRGLSRFDPLSESFKNFDTSHGLQSNEFNFGAYYETSSGELLFGGINGFNLFDPGEVPENGHVPPIVLTRVLKLDKPAPLSQAVWQTRELRLDYDDYVASFEFAALDYTSPEANRYAYKLDGFNRDWIDLGEFRRVSFTNLDPGHYVLRVKGANNEGVWNEAGISVAIEVVPPPWRTWWAYSLYTLLFVAAFNHYLRRHQRRLAREAEYTRRLEEEVAQRTRELASGCEELARLNQRLEEASMADSLTGLRNRRYVIDNIEREISATLRPYDSRNDTGAPRRSLLLLMLDLDGYKQINDRHGHDVGDRVLLQIRLILEEACRTSDILARWGGDEFLVIGQVSEQKHSRILAERIHRMVREYSFGYEGGPELRMTCSIGFACFPFFPANPTLGSWKQVLTLADRALYIAKNNGRDGWVGLFSKDNVYRGDFLQAMLDDPERLMADGFLEVATSIPVKLDFSLKSMKVAAERER
jgi:diguanylate cyclase (GGDEF)-like protein